MKLIRPTRGETGSKRKRNPALRKRTAIENAKSSPKTLGKRKKPNPQEQECRFVIDLEAPLKNFCQGCGNFDIPLLHTGPV